MARKRTRTRHARNAGASKRGTQAGTAPSASRPDAKPQRGRIQTVPLLLTLAAGFGLALLVWPSVFAANPRVADLVEEVETQPARHRKLMALKRLSDMDSRAARAAIEELAESDDEMTSLAAISTMSREDLSGFRDALEDVVDDTDRSDAVRCAALGACMKLRKGDRKKWSAVKDWVEERTEDEEDMEKFAAAYSKRLWGSEVSDE